MRTTVAFAPRAGALAALALLASCDRNRSETAGAPRTGEPIPDHARIVAPDTHTSVTQAIVQARCDREQRCENVGDGREYASRAACEAAVRGHWREELGVAECPAGLDADDVRACMESIRGEACGEPLGTLARHVRCRLSDLCKD